MNESKEVSPVHYTVLMNKSPEQTRLSGFGSQGTVMRTNSAEQSVGILLSEKVISAKVKAAVQSASELRSTLAASL